MKVDIGGPEYGSFSFDITLRKAKTDSQGRMIVTGIASNTLDDRQGHRITSRGIGQMAKSCKEGIDLLDSHFSTFGFGRSIDGFCKTGSALINGKIVPKQELVVKFELDPEFPQSKKLFEEVSVGKSRKQLSIGGKINKKNPRAVRWVVKEDGTTIQELDDILLDHITTTRAGQAANAGTSFVNAIFKSLIDSGYVMEENMNKKKKVQGTQPSDESVAKTQETDEATEEQEDEVTSEAEVKKTGPFGELVADLRSLFFGKEDESVVALRKTIDAVKDPDKLSKSDRKTVEGLFQGFLNKIRGEQEETQEEQEETTTLKADPETLVQLTGLIKAVTAIAAKLGVADPALAVLATNEDAKIGKSLDQLNERVGSFGDQLKAVDTIQKSIDGIEAAVVKVQTALLKTAETFEGRLSKIENKTGGSQALRGQERDDLLDEEDDLDEEEIGDADPLVEKALGPSAGSRRRPTKSRPFGNLLHPNMLEAIRSHRSGRRSG